MRIIGGKLKGKNIAAPDGLKTRPTTGRIRETVFNILTSKNALIESKVLDLFCGSGALGIESLSRGAKEAVFVDKNKISAKLTRENLSACGFLNGAVKDVVARVYNTDFQVALEKLEGEKFDIIFLDPPYFDKLEEKCLILIEKYQILADDGLIVFEHSAKNDLSDKAQGFIIDTRKFGSVSVSFLSKN